MTDPSPMPRWPLVPIALPAAVAIWSGWVGLGGLCGFGPVHVLPGINDGATINTAICLPVGMEAYAAYALAVWLRPVPVPDDAREFAKWSAAGALGLGMLGQVAFHVLTSLGWSRAPVWVVVLVSCIPVLVVGLAAVLAHLMSRAPDAGDALTTSSAHAVPAAVPVKAGARVRLPGIAEIRKRQNCGQETALKARAEVQLDRRSRGGPLSTAAVPVARVPAGVLPEAAAQPAPAGTHPAMNGSHGG